MSAKLTQASVKSNGTGFVVRLRRPMSPDQYQRRFAAEMVRLRRHYAIAFALWRECRRVPCRRRRSCTGDAAICLKRGLDGVPRHAQFAAREKLLQATPANIGAPERFVRGFMPSALFE